MPRHSSTDAAARPILFPYPQRRTDRPGAFRARGPVGVFCLGTAERSACRELARAASLEAAPADRRRARVLVGVGLEAKALLGELGLRAPAACLAAEGYALEVSPARIVVAAGDDRGLLYALQSLGQAVQRGPGGARVVPCLSLRDWPRFPVRGAHVYLPARREMPFFRRLIEFLARCRFNTLFLEIGAGMEYKRHPEINAGWERLAREADAFPASQSRMQNSAPGHKNSIHIELGGGSFLTQAEVRRIASWCAENRIEVVPEVQSLSHSYYLLANHRELAENLDDRWPDTYCPSNPDTYKLLFDLFDEVIEVLRPRTISIGHDEVYALGLCPRCRGRDPGRLLADDVNRIHDYLAAQGVRTAMWSEKLTHKPGPARPIWQHRRFGREFRAATPDTTGALDRVPRDILLLNWYYSVDPESVAFLRRKGFEAILGNYNAFFYVKDARRKAGHSLDDALAQGGKAAFLGAEVSTWCAPAAKNFSPYPFLSNALSLWTRELTPRLIGRMDADLVGVHRREGHFLAGTRSVLASEAPRRFAPVALEPVADVICDGQGRMWGGFGSMDLRDIPSGDVTLAGVPFRVIDYPRTRQCPFVGVDGNVRNSFPIPVGCKARALVFLHTSSVRVRNLSPWTSLKLGEPVVAAYEVVYADGRKVEAPVVHNWNIGSVSNDSGRPPTHGDLAWRGRNEPGPRMALYCFEWVNPRPEVRIESVTMVWKGGYLEGDVVLAGLTAVE